MDYQNGKLAGLFHSKLKVTTQANRLVYQLGKGDGKRQQAAYINIAYNPHQNHV